MPKRSRKRSLCKCGHHIDAHERSVWPDHVKRFMDEEAARVHEGLELKAIDEDEHNKRIGEILDRHKGELVMTVGHCTMCGYAECSGFRDAGEIGNLSERLAKVEARLDAIEHGKPIKR